MANDSNTDQSGRENDEDGASVAVGSSETHQSSSLGTPRGLDDSDSNSTKGASTEEMDVSRHVATSAEDTRMVPV